MKYILLIASMLSTSMVYAQTRIQNEPEKRPIPIVEQTQREIVDSNKRSVPVVEKEQKEKVRSSVVQKLLQKPKQRVDSRLTTIVTQLTHLSNRMKTHFEKNASSMKTDEALVLLQQAEEKLTAIRTRIGTLSNEITQEEIKAIHDELKEVRLLLIEAIRTFKSLNSN